MWATHTHCAQTYIPSRHISTWHKINIFLKPYVTFFSYHYFGILKIIINHSDHWTTSQSFSFLPVISTKFIKILFDLNSGPKVHTWQFIYYTHHLFLPFQKKKKVFSLPCQTRSKGYLFWCGKKISTEVYAESILSHHQQHNCWLT